MMLDHIGSSLALLLGTLMSGIFSLVGVLITYFSMGRTRRSQAAVKISEFRQEWINSLRDTFSEFSALGAVGGAYDPGAHERLFRLGTKIQLLMNPNDKDYIRLNDLMHAYLGPDFQVEIGERTLDQEFVATCQGILKREWDRVKEDIDKNRILSNS